MSSSGASSDDDDKKAAEKDVEEDQQKKPPDMKFMKLISSARTFDKCTKRFSTINLRNKVTSVSRCVNIMTEAEERSHFISTSALADENDRPGTAPIATRPVVGNALGSTFTFGFRKERREVTDYYTPEEVDILEDVILKRTDFLRFAPPTLMKRLVQSLRLLKVQPFEYLARKKEVLTEIVFLLCGRIGVYTKAEQADHSERDEYGDTLPEVYSRVNVVNSVYAVEEKAVLFGQQIAHFYKALLPKNEAQTIVCATISILDAGVHDIFDHLCDRYFERLRFCRNHLPSGNRYPKNDIDKIANGCTEESFLPRASLSSLLDGVVTKQSFCVVSSGVVTCGPRYHPNLELHRGGILGIQSNMSLRGGIWAKTAVVIRSWPWKNISGSSLEPGRRKERKVHFAVAGKKRAVPSVPEILTNLSLDHLRSVGGDHLIGRLRCYAAAIAKPKVMGPSRQPSWKSAQLLKLCMKSRPPMRIPDRRDPATKKAELLLLGPRSSALKMIQDDDRPSTAMESPVKEAAQRALAAFPEWRNLARQRPSTAAL